jgi:hypothetical protein
MTKHRLNYYEQINYEKKELNMSNLIQININMR